MISQSFSEVIYKDDFTNPEKWIFVSDKVMGGISSGQVIFNSKDDETRYNLALAQELLEDQQQNQDKNDNNKDNKDDQKDQDKDQENKDDQKDKKDNKNKEDKKDGDDEKDKKEGQDDPKENKDQQDNQQQPSQPGKLSPQRIQQLLEAMNNEEKKTQEKMNARKEKGQKIKQEKDW